MDYMLDLPDYLTDEWLDDLDRHLENIDDIDKADQLWDEDEIALDAASDWENERNEGNS